jgi:putative ABC transport system permease protein
VATLFGLGPALQASFIQPAGALKSGGGTDSRRHRRVMDVLIGVQAAFGFFVVFSAGLFVLTSSRLSHQSTGFSADRILILDTVARQAVPSSAWNAVREELLHVPGSEMVALADAPLLGNSLWGGYVAVNGGRPFSNPAFFLKVSPGWLATMRIPLIDGRDFRRGDMYPRAAIVNEAFAKEFLTGTRRLGTAFTTVLDRDKRVQIEIVGVVRNARYGDLRGPMPPVAYFPFDSLDIEGTPATSDSATLVVRTTGSNPLAAAPSLRRAVSRARPDFRVSNIQTQEEINAAQTVRERLVATLAVFFGIVALLLSGIGLYGIVDYSVFRRSREIAIRTAIGAQAGHIARQVTRSVFVMLPVGASVGFIMGFLSTRYIQTLLFHVQATEPVVLAIPILTVVAAAATAVMPALLHALRIEPAAVLRAE